MAEPTYREKTKAAMLASAERILAEEGLAGIQARRIAKEADCAVGTLYNIFKGLDELIITANARTLERLGTALTQARDGAADRTVGGQLMALALAYLAFASRHERPWRAIFEHHMSEGGDVPDWYRETQARLFSLVEGLLGETVGEPGERARAARAMFAAVHGVVAIALDHKLGQQSTVEIEAQVRFIVSAIASGLGARAGEQAQARG
jgi:AcrR family transcriptional regulator